jgi:Phospholipase_D-nuclease N-terminal
MTVFWIIGGCALAVIWVISIVDVFRRHHSGAATVGWLALIVLLPFIGALIYWATRKPTPGEVEQQYLGEAELRRSAAARPFDSTGL